MKPAPVLSDRIPQLIAYALIGLGISLRLVIFFQNRNLIIDEANIVRNLAERGFAGLATPLKYEQFAPPVFLWIEKAASLLAGNGEKAMRFYSLVCGIAALAVFYKVAQRITRPVAILLPLSLFAASPIFIEFSACVKQYMPDALIALSLIWCALSWDIRTMRRPAFTLRWMIAGSLAIWASMPAVFTLTGVGAYYGFIALREKRSKDWLPLLAIGAIWLAQFALYYVTILKAQIGSEYLQNYHHDYFLFATPSDAAEWAHNWTRIEALLAVMGGVKGVAIGTNLALMTIGAIALLARHTTRAMLIVLPIVLVLIAAALNQYSLIERVALFMLPLWLLLVGAGIEAVWNRLNLLAERSSAARISAAGIKALLLTVFAYIFYAGGNFILFSHRYTFHEITNGLEYLQSRGARGPQVYVHDANVPTYLYYTALHPGRDHWKSLLGAHRLTWDNDYTEVTRGLKDTAYFLYTGGFPEGERTKRTAQIEANMRQVDYFEKDICFVYVYVPK